MAWIEHHRTGFRVGWRDEAGRTQHTPNSYTTREMAEVTQHEIERKAQRQALVQSIDANSRPIEQIVKEWIDSLPIAPITKASYERSIFPAFLAHFAGRSISTITRQDISAYFAERRQHVQVSTLGRDFSIIRSFFACATEEYLLPTNPAKNIRIPRVQKSTGICLSFEQERRLLAAVTERQRAKVLLARDAGLRAANLGNLRRADVDLEYKTLTFHVLKKRVRSLEEAETRTLPLTKRLEETLEQFQHTDSQEPLFTYNGKPLTDPDKFLKRLRPRLGFHFRWHDLRHTFYTRLLEACDNYALAEWSLGHAITYWHPTPEKLREAFSKMQQRQRAAFESQELEAMHRLRKEQP
jgi:site-specific recombinase XerD